jgi:hypothetical protein
MLMLLRNFNQRLALENSYISRHSKSICLPNRNPLWRQYLVMSIMKVARPEGLPQPFGSLLNMFRHQIHVLASKLNLAFDTFVRDIAPIALLLLL